MSVVRLRAVIVWAGICWSWHPFAMVQILALAVSKPVTPPTSCSHSRSLSSHLGKIKALTDFGCLPRSWLWGGGEAQQVLANCPYAWVRVTSAT